MQTKIQNIAFDDFSLIEWQNAYSKSLKSNVFNFGETQACVIGFNKGSQQPLVLEFTFKVEKNG
ncbi:hypothetical protein Sps_02109 [Shewanella psychrophila]|uniref:Uncharacterized protein n=1 Tax=Shewanella psychrophila TaxID=225848 RepID=A0A1S6HP41_9GAMM|nr:hypothetical protein [Shewanella psychrophila]AQS37268.1 hypothetical protein Sps_02109 [Shewanella psychrophila]